MCYNCGCCLPHDTMGDERNITEATLQKIAARKNIPLSELKKDLLQSLIKESVNDPDYTHMFQQASEAWGQSVEEAQKETRKLLEHQLGHDT